MKVSNIKDIEGFFKVIDQCKGKVELVTGEGDRLNLKSKLSQYVSMAKIFSNGEIPEMELIAHEKEDGLALVSTNVCSLSRRQSSVEAPQCGHLTSGE